MTSASGIDAPADAGSDPVAEAGRDPGFVERTSSELAAQGFPRMAAGVIMALTASADGRLTARELGEVLGVSAGAVSGAVSYLSTLGMVRSSLVPGTRRHLYSLPDDSRPWYTVSLTRPGLYAHVTAVLRAELVRLPAGPARERVRDMADFFAFIDERMPRLLDEWNATRAARASD